MSTIKDFMRSKRESSLDLAAESSLSTSGRPLDRSPILSDLVKHVQDYKSTDTESRIKLERAREVSKFAISWCCKVMVI